MVAGTLRRRILDGELEDGSWLPKQEDLIDEFGVSKPSMREAMRILETEGLLTVQRGNVGGAVVHTPRQQTPRTPSDSCCSRGTSLVDVGPSLKHIDRSAHLCVQNGATVLIRAAEASHPPCYGPGERRQ